jgi:hypothetical protein
MREDYSKSVVSLLLEHNLLVEEQANEYFNYVLLS